MAPEYAEHDEDSDFSYISSPSEESENDDTVHRPVFIDPVLMKTIPRHCLVEPLLRDDFKWKCPIRPCPFGVDLMNLTDDNIPYLTKEMLAVETSDGTRSLNQKFLHDGFRSIVEAHYLGHLTALDIKIESVCVPVDDCDKVLTRN